MKDVQRVQRSIEYVRSNNYPAVAVFAIVNEEGFKVRIRLPEENKELLQKLQEFVEGAVRASTPLTFIETYLYSYGASFELVDPDTDQTVGSYLEVETPSSAQEERQDKDQP